jgi:DNA modification methylase
LSAHGATTRVISLLMGDCRVTLATLPQRSVQCVITSPPYYALRDYGLPPLVWGGDAEHPQTRFKGDTIAARANTEYADVTTGFCPCGAWLGSFGLEPTPELYIEHMVEVFRQVRRVLRDDGTVWINLGDSYAGSGKGPTGHNGIQGDASCIGAPERGLLSNRRSSGVRGSAGPAQGIYKAKDLMMLPARVAMALQADGWYLRSMIPWLKRNSMPESVTDRPATAVEYVFLLSKQSRYYWDADAVRVEQSANTHARFGKDATASTRRKISDAGSGIKANGSFIAATDNMILPNGRNRRSSDWFFETWQGLLLDEQDEPLALVVNPSPYKEAHYATFPPKLVEPMIKASTSEKGCCPECGAPWARVTEVLDPNSRLGKGYHDHTDDLGRGQRGVFPAEGAPSKRTTGWRPTCAHAAEPVPQTVLDCFGGSGTVGLVADRLNRNAILCELKPDYSHQANGRIIDDAPLFSTLEMFA